MSRHVRIKIDAVFEWNRDLTGIPTGTGDLPLAMLLGEGLKKYGAVSVVKAWREIGIVDEPKAKPRKVLGEREARKRAIALRARKDKALGVLPLGKAKCDDCGETAFTRWYDRSEGRERVAYTLCKAHNDDMIRRNAETRKELGLDRPETPIREDEK